MQAFNMAAQMISSFFAQIILPIIVSLVVTIVGYNYLRKKDKEKNFKYAVKTYWTGFLFWFLITGIMMLIGVDLKETTAIMQAEDINYFTMFLFPQPIFWIIGTLLIPLLLLQIDASRPNRNSEIIKEMDRMKKIQDPSVIPYDYEKNIFVSGKNGAGKTVAILNFIEHHIRNNEFCLIMDGKGDLGEYGLYDVCTKLAMKYDRPLYIINQSNPDETHSYNPFAGCNATQIKDMLINMSQWSEEHYKALASEYWQAMCQFMIDFNVPIHFGSLIEYSNPSWFEDEIETFKTLMPKEQYRYYKHVIFNSRETVASARSRFSTLAYGVGKNLFKNENTFSLKDAYEEKAVVLVILNNLEYTDFARSVGRLVLDDIKNLVGGLTRIRAKAKFLCVYDELSVYFDEMLVDIVNKSRSLGGCNILSTQTIADMDIINQNARRQIIGNMHGFYLLKQADDQSAETLAKTIGTKKASEITSKIDSYGKTGDGTSKIVDEFKIHPNDLKELPLEVGYWIDTMDDKSIPIRTRMKYVDVSDIPEYQFAPIVKKNEQNRNMQEDTMSAEEREALIKEMEAWSEKESVSDEENQ